MMWVLTEQNSLLNLDRHARIEVQHRRVIAWFDSDEGYVDLCTCDDVAHGKAIVEQLGHEILGGKPLVYMSDVKRQASPPIQELAEDGDAS